MEETLLADGFEEAFLGYIERCGQPVMAVYSYDKALDILTSRDGMTEEDAAEYLSFNVTGAWVGKGTPGFLVEASLDDFNYMMGGMDDEV